MKELAAQAKELSQATSKLTPEIRAAEIPTTAARRRPLPSRRGLAPPSPGPTVRSVTCRCFDGPALH
jgi:hypothetical protein